MAENIKLARERAKIEREIAAIKKTASKEERAHTDSELKKLEEYRKRKRQIAKEQSKDEEASIANENKKYGLQLWKNNYKILRTDFFRIRHPNNS